MEAVDQPHGRLCHILGVLTTEFSVIFSLIFPLFNFSLLLLFISICTSLYLYTYIYSPPQTRKSNSFSIICLTSLLGFGVPAVFPAKQAAWYLRTRWLPPGAWVSQVPGTHLRLREGWAFEGPCRSVCGMSYPSEPTKSRKSPVSDVWAYPPPVSSLFKTQLTKLSSAACNLEVRQPTRKIGLRMSPQGLDAVQIICLFWIIFPI